MSILPLHHEQYDGDGYRMANPLSTPKVLYMHHLITIPSLFLAGVIFIDSPFVYKLFGQPSFNEYFYNHDTLRHISLINDRFSGLNEISDI